jgi:molecular chaperone GrpE
VSAREPDIEEVPQPAPQEEPSRPHGDELGDLTPDGTGDAPAPPAEAEPAAPDGPAGGEAVGEAPTVEDVDVPRLLEERAEYLDAYQRTRAEFENYKKRMMARQADELERAAEYLVDKLLPVLDACESAIDHGHTDVEPVFAALLGTLEKEGLTRIHPGDEPFDPVVHEAVIHEPGDGGETVVVEVLRTGYAWKGRLLRPAMVKVSG